MFTFFAKLFGMLTKSVHVADRFLDVGVKSADMANNAMDNLIAEQAREAQKLANAAKA